MLHNRGIPGAVVFFTCSLKRIKIHNKLEKETRGEKD
jgi:hypothetical protein